MNENEIRTTTTEEYIPSYVDIETYSKTYEVLLEYPSGFVTGTVTCDEEDPILEQLRILNENQTMTIELLQKDIEIQQQMHGLTSYILIALIGFALIKFFSGFLNSVISF